MARPNRSGLTHSEYMTKYDAEHYKKVLIKVNKVSDKDILERLSEVENMSQYIKGLIREDIKKKG